jgi:hypothetical protein
MKSRVIAVSVLSLALLFVTNQAISAPSSGCASVSIGSSAGTNLVPPGTGIVLYGPITNCSSHKDRLTLNVTAISSCGQTASVASSRLALDGGQTLIWNAPYTIPLNTCSGPWVATVSVNDSAGSQTRELSGTNTSASTTITVQ